MTDAEMLALATAATPGKFSDEDGCSWEREGPAMVTLPAPDVISLLKRLEKAERERNDMEAAFGMQTVLIAKLGFCIGAADAMRATVFPANRIRYDDARAALDAARGKP